MREFDTLEVDEAGAVATVRIRPFETTEQAVQGDIHWDLGTVMSEIRGDNGIRVVVLTGAEDGVFIVAPRTEVSRSELGKATRNDPKRLWRIFTGVVRFHEAMVALEKPVVARVNGDAIGFGQSVMFASDLIVAREDARIADMHLGLGDVAPYGPPYGIVPGDGGAVYAPLYMSPALAKEYLMLAKEYSAKDLADRGMINYAVPAGEVDGVVRRLVDELLRRPSYALAWTKRVLGKVAAQQIATVLDAAAAYELVNFLQIERFNWEDPHEL